MPIKPIIPKLGEIFFVLPIGSMTLGAVREELERREGVSVELVRKVCAVRGNVEVFEMDSFLIDYLITNPTWTSHKFIVYHEINGEFSLWEPEKGIRRPPFVAGTKIVPASSFKASAKKRQGRNL